MNCSDLPVSKLPYYKYLDPIIPEFIESFTVQGGTLDYQVKRSDLGIDTSGHYHLQSNELFGLWLISVVNIIKKDAFISENIQNRMTRRGLQVFSDSNLGTEFQRHSNNHAIWQLQSDCIDGTIKEQIEYWGYNCDEEWLAKAKELAHNSNKVEELIQYVKDKTCESLTEYVDVRILSCRLLFNYCLIHEENNDGSHRGISTYFIPAEVYLYKSIFFKKVYSVSPSRKGWMDPKRFEGPDSIMGSYYISKASTYYQTFPFFYLYELMCNGGFCNILFDFINDSEIIASHKVRLIQSIVTAGRGENMQHLRMLETLYEPYRQVGGANIHFWPWRYAEIRADFVDFYKEVTHHETKRKLPHGFLSVCLPIIVEEILPSIRNATQAVALVSLIQNAKDFGEEWRERFSAEAFKERMLKILRLDEFVEQAKNLRIKNKRVREVASFLFDEFPVLKKFTNLVEGD